MTIPLSFNSLHNYTGHDVVVETTEGVVTFPPMGHARVTSKSRVVERVAYLGIGRDAVNWPQVEERNIPIRETVERRVVGLPLPVHEVLYIVSGIVAAAANRPDLLVPAILDRDGAGRVIRCKAFRRLGTGEGKGKEVVEL